MTVYLQQGYQTQLHKEPKYTLGYRPNWINMFKTLKT